MLYAFSITATTDGSFATTSAVAGMPSNNDISPTHAPGSLMAAINCPAFSTRKPPSSSTYNVPTESPSAISDSPSATESSRKSVREREQFLHRRSVARTGAVRIPKVTLTIP